MSKKPTTAARILSALSNSHSAYSGALSERTGIAKATVIKHLRALAARDFLYCNDDFDGRQRKGGKYANALWVINVETSGFTPEQAQIAIDTEGNGYGILIDMDLGC